MKYYLVGDEEYIKLTELIDFASKEDNNKININGRIYASPVCCKDCKYWKMNITVIPTSEINNAMYCTRYMWMTHTDADDFCSKGEKKDGVD